MNAGPALILCELTAVVAASCMLFSSKMFHTVLLFLTVMLAVAGIYALLGATYLFIVQLAIYGGGVAVLMLFAVMIAGRSDAAGQWSFRWPALVPPVAMLVFLVLQPVSRTSNPIVRETDTADAGVWLNGDFSLPFALSAILLLVALVGAIVIVIQKPEQNDA